MTNTVVVIDTSTILNVSRSSGVAGLNALFRGRDVLLTQSVIDELLERMGE